jgi:hypothetical protein
VIWVGLTIVLGDVRRWPKTPKVGSPSNRCPEHQGAKVIRGSTLAPLLRGMGLHLSMVPSFDGVTNIVIVTDPMMRGGTPRRKVTPSLLLRLGAPGSWPVRAVAKGVTAAPPTCGACASKQSPLGVAIIWDDRENMAWHWDAELLTCCSWVTRRCLLGCR